MSISKEKVDFPVKYRNERDVEIPLLMKFVKDHPDIKTALDVGCARAFYISWLRHHVLRLDGIDFDFDESINRYLSNYFTADFVGVDLDQYDLVTAISTVEHYGIKQKPDKCPFCVQIKFIEQMAWTTKKYLFLTFPYGQSALVKDEFMVYSALKLKTLLSSLEDFGLVVRFFYNRDPRQGLSWQECGSTIADDVWYDPEKGVQCVCVIEGVKKDV